jgi:hypothetical protein
MQVFFLSMLDCGDRCEVDELIKFYYRTVRSGFKRSPGHLIFWYAAILLNYHLDFL